MRIHLTEHSPRTAWLAGADTALSRPLIRNARGMKAGYSGDPSDCAWNSAAGRAHSGCMTQAVRCRTLTEMYSRRIGKVGNLAGSACEPLAAATGVVARAGMACGSKMKVGLTVRVDVRVGSGSGLGLRRLVSSWTDNACRQRTQLEHALMTCVTRAGKASQITMHAQARPHRASQWWQCCSPGSGQR